MPTKTSKASNNNVEEIVEGRVVTQQQLDIEKSIIELAERSVIQAENQEYIIEGEIAGDIIRMDQDVTQQMFALNHSHTDPKLVSLQYQPELKKVASLKRVSGARSDGSGSSTNQFFMPKINATPSTTCSQTPPTSSGADSTSIMSAPYKHCGLFDIVSGQSEKKAVLPMHKHDVTPDVSVVVSALDPPAPRIDDRSTVFSAPHKHCGLFDVVGGKQKQKSIPELTPADASVIVSELNPPAPLVDEKSTVLSAPHKHCGLFDVVSNKSRKKTSPEPSVVSALNPPAPSIATDDKSTVLSAPHKHCGLFDVVPNKSKNKFVTQPSPEPSVVISELNPPAPSIVDDKSTVLSAPHKHCGLFDIISTRSAQEKYRVVTSPEPAKSVVASTVMSEPHKHCGLFSVRSSPNKYRIAEANPRYSAPVQTVHTDASTVVSSVIPSSTVSSSVAPQKHCGLFDVV